MVYVTNAGPGDEAVALPDAPKYEGDEEGGEQEPLLGGTAPQSAAENLNVEYGKLDIETVVSDAVLSTGSDKRILLATCGPKTLMDAVRDSVDMHCRKTSSSIDVHCEDFGS